MSPPVHHVQPVGSEAADTLGHTINSSALIWFHLPPLLPYEPSLAQALGAHERAVRRGPDPV